MKSYQSHETFVADLRMLFQMLRTALFVAVGLQLVIFYLMFAPSYKKLTSTVIGDVPVSPAQILKYSINIQERLKLPHPMVGLNHHEQRLFRGAEQVHIAIYRYWMDRWTNGAFAYTVNRFKGSIRLSFVSYLFCLFYVIYFSLRSRTNNEEKLLRGMELMPIKKFNAKLQSNAEKEYAKKPIPNLRIGDTLIPREMETSHLLVLGATRTGKGVLLNQLIRQINERKITHGTNEKIIHYDLKGEFVSKHYEPGRDIIFYPYDKRSIGWNVFNEIETYPDFDTVAKSLYTSTDTRDEYWYNCARDVFRMGLVYLKRRGLTNNRELWRFFSQNLDNLKKCLEALPLEERAAIKHIEKSDTNQAATILSIVQERIQFFRYLVDVDGDFSLRRYIRDEKDCRNLFLLNVVNYAEIFKPLMTFAVDTIIRETLSLPDKLERRVFFILDEIGSLYRLNSLLDLLTVGASKGGSLICANQDIGRIEETYGRSNAKTFFNNFNTDIILRVNEPETADFLSKAFGERHVVKRMETRAMSPSKYGDSKSFSEQEKTERIFLSSEFQSLPNLEAIIKISNYGISKIRIPKVFLPAVQEHFLMKDFSIGNMDV